MSFAEVNGANLYYEIEGAGPALLLIHAGIADSAMWDDQFAWLAESHRVLRFDLRGFGQSDLPAGTFSNVEDVSALLEFLNIERIRILGCSFGALIALDFALTHPERVTGLILCSPSVSGAQPSDRIQQFWEAEEAAIDHGDLEGATELNLRMWVDGPQRSPGEVDASLRRRVSEMQLNIFHKPVPDGVEERPADRPAIARLGEVAAPTLIIAGTIDLEEKVELAHRLAGEIPGASLELFEGAAHLVNMEMPESFSSVVTGFLARL